MNSKQIVVSVKVGRGLRRKRVGAISPEIALYDKPHASRILRSASYEKANKVLDK